MPLSTEAIIAIVTLITTCPPVLILLWSRIRRSQRRKAASPDEEASHGTTPAPSPSGQTISTQENLELSTGNVTLLNPTSTDSQEIHLTITMPPRARTVGRSPPETPSPAPTPDPEPARPLPSHPTQPTDPRES